MTQFKTMLRNLILYLFFAITTNHLFGQSHPMPSIVERDGRHMLLVDGEPFFILGGQVHNSSAWPAMMPQVWRAADKIHLNTLEIPIYWEQIEPAYGKFDFSMIDTLISQARKHRVHLILLWFATWKNGSNHYMPEWMKYDAVKYPNVTAKNGQPVDSPSPNIDATLQADMKAFTAVMKHLKAADGEKTIIMVQVENEAGSWGSVRDYSATAQKLFDAPVPPELLTPQLLNALNKPVITKGTWQQVFGADADEYFHAWSIAKFIGRVAAAGKAEYPLPMYVNTALRDPLTNPSASTYESGGPTDNVIPIWKAAAPAIDILAPDIYLTGNEKILKVIDLYDRPDNPLFVPEVALTSLNAKYLYQVIAHGGIGFCPFGIDKNSVQDNPAETLDYLTPFAHEYATVSPMMRQLAQWSFDGKVKAVVERENHASQTIDLGAWQAFISFGNAGNNKTESTTQSTGKAMIVQLTENQFIVIGTTCHLTFHPAGSNSGKAWQYLKVEEVQFDKGSMKLLRVRNGDETDWGGPDFSATSVILRITLVVR